MKLKGRLITKGFTEIIHIADENEDFYLNSFSSPLNNKKEAEHYVLDFVAKHNLSDIITLFDTIRK